MDSETRKPNVSVGPWPADLFADPVIREIRASLAAAEPDCECRRAIEETLDRAAYSRLWHNRTAALAEARDRRRRILALIDLLAEIDDITAEEADMSALEEAAALFGDIAAAAHAGAEAARRAGAGPHMEEEYHVD